MNQEQNVTGGRPEPRDESRQGRRPYEAPHLVPFGHVKELTAGGKPGISDITSAGSII
jgi:hypothetical protein